LRQASTTSNISENASRNNLGLLLQSIKSKYISALFK
jgi:hypothetical protein